MKIWVKALLGIMLSFMCIFTCVGYAAISGSMYIDGQVQARPPVYTDLVITDIVVCSGENVVQKTSRVVPTNVRSTFTGKAGDTVTYQITAHNYSESTTYVYSGITYDDSYSSVVNNMSINVSADQAGSSVIPVSKEENYIQGTPVAPGEEIVFYATYTLNADITAREVMINYKFLPVHYTITYLNDNAVYAVDCITDNTKVYDVKSNGPDKDGKRFAGWVNASAQHVLSYPAENTTSYTLSATWDNLYLIIFVDNDGNVIYQETFVKGQKSISSEGQAIVNAKLAEFAAQTDEDMAVSWSSYTLNNAEDVIVRPVYTYNGNLNYVPIDSNGDGIIDYYQVEAVSVLDETTKIRGQFMGLQVKTVEKLYKNENNTDYGSGVKVIEIGEGVENINRNALAYTSDLTTVKLPSTIKELGKNVFSRNYRDDIKKLNIEFNGTMAEWKAIAKHEDWHNGLADGTRVICTDGYFELDRGLLGNISINTTYKWSEHPN